MGNFTDLFIRKPVLAMVVSLTILVLGLRALGALPVLQYPRTESATITITTTYPGADPDTVAGYITTPLENAVAQVNGIDYMTSTSQTSTSTITINLALNHPADSALTEVSARINSVLNQLPVGTQQPVLTLQEGQTVDALFIGFDSTVLTPSQVSDYLVRVVQPQIQAVPGVQTAEILGVQNFAMRIWLKPDKLASFGLTAADVSTALADNNFIAALGNTKGEMVQVSLAANTDLHAAQEFADLVVRQQNGAIIRLRDVADIQLGSDTYDQNVTFNGKAGQFIGVQVAPGANLLDVVAGVRRLTPGILAQLPAGLHGTIAYDSTAFVNASIYDVLKSLVESLLIVTLVIFAFLGSPRAIAIPVIAMPLSLIGTFAIMLMLGFTVNLLTLLALVLAIGLVVDDAIIVVENVNRHIEQGEAPLQAALMAARELSSPIIAMTLVLISVYVPIGFQSGLTGALFTEFAFTVAAAVTISAITALTLTPMMSSRILIRLSHDDPNWETRIVAFIDRRFDEVHRLYTRLLASSLATLPVTLVFAAIVLGSIYFLASGAKSELAPQEDIGFIANIATAPPNATFEQRVLWDRAISKIVVAQPATGNSFQVDVPGNDITGVAMKPWDQRSQTSTQMQNLLQSKIDSTIAGEQIVSFQPPALPGAEGLPFSYVIKTTGPIANLYPIAQQLLAAALKSGKFVFLTSDLKIDQPQSNIVIDRDKAALLGLNMSAIGAALSDALGGNYVNYFSLDDRSYKVIPQVQRISRLNPAQLGDYSILSANGISVPLSAVARITTSVIPESINHFQQQNSATLAGVAAPGVSQQESLATMQRLAAQILPSGYTADYAGPLRQFVQEKNGFLGTFGFAIVIIFLALSALFNSFRDPLIILVSVPMSIAGALIFIYLGFGGVSLNIYTEVGLVTLMGLVSKHGILMVDVANEAQLRGMSRREAIEYAAGIRLRPILMTTAAMVLGVLPLIFSTGAGAAARVNMGVVIASGLAIGTAFTLFVVPAVYLVLAARKTPVGPATG